MENRASNISSVSQQLKSRASSELASSQQDWDEHVGSPMRKRPRLDNRPLAGQPARGSLSPKEDASIDTTSVDSEAQSSSSQNEQRSPTSPSTPTAPGKVTLNLRSSRLKPRSPSPIYVAKSTSSVERDFTGHLTYEVHLHQPSTLPNSMDVTAASTTSSPRSPPVVEIEVDEAEDMNDDAYSVVNVIANDMDRESLLMESFPFAAEHGIVTAASMLATAIAKDQIEIQWLVQISEWLEEWLRYAQSSPVRSQRAYATDYDFWCTIAQIYGKFLARKTQFGNFGGKQSEGPRARIIQRIFGPYIELADQMMQMELVHLHRVCLEAKSSADPISAKHLKNLEMIFRPAQDVPLWRVLTHIYHINVEQIQHSWALGTLQQHSQVLMNVTALTKLLAQHIDILSKFSPLLESAGQALRNMNVAARSYLRQVGVDNLPTLYKALRPDLLELVTIFEQQLVQDLDRQTACLSIELSVTMVKLAIQILFEIALVDPATAMATCGEGLEGLDELASAEVSRVLRDCLYFKLMWKCVAKGRMELRVQGVNMISEMLVILWRDYNVPQKPLPNPIMKLMAKLLLREKVVEYLISVESHPQLITRSRDILGFLFVTHCWTREMTDHFWSTMLLLQDRRILAAALDVHAGILSLSQASQLLDFVEKLYNLPLSAFGPEVRQFMRTLLSDFAPDASVATGFQTNPHNLCVHILQRTNTDATHNTSEHDQAEVRALAFDMLQKMSLKTPNEVERQRLYQLCLHEIESQSAKALGSVDAMIALATVHKSDAQLLAVDLNLPRILAREICAINVAKKAAPGGVEQNVLERTPFLKLFTMLMTHCLDFSMPPNLESELWDHLIGSEACDDNSRDDAWGYLREVVANVGGSSNPFVDRLIEQYISSLPPRLFTFGMFKFVEASIQYMVQIHPPSPPSEHKTISIPLSDLLWKIILDGPSDVITEYAIALLSQYHLETSLTATAPASSVASTHVKLIDRCVKQLEEAAGLLASGNSAQTTMLQNSGKRPEVQEDYQVTSYTNNKTDEFRFTRTLQFLQKFLSDVKSKPGFREAVEKRQSSSPEPPTVEASEGASLVLKYQSFDAGRQGDIKHLKITDDANFSDVAEKLREVTGFTRISLIYGGKTLDLSANPEQPASGLQGLLLVRNLGIIDPPTLRVPHNRSAAEKAIFAHFDTFYSFLDLTEKLSAPVYQFLGDFPPHSRVREAVLRETTSLLELCPSDRRTRTLYSLSSLQKCLVEQLNTGTSDDQFILHGVRLLATAITDSHFYMAYLRPPGDSMVTSTLVQCLLAFLKERPVQSKVASYLTDEKVLVGRLFDLLIAAEDDSNSRLAQESWLIYSTIIEATFHSSVAWEAFTAQESIAEIHFWLMTSDATRFARDRVNICIESTFTGTSTLSVVDSFEYAAFYWRIFSEIIPRSSQCSSQSGYLLATSATIFSKHAAALADEQTLRSYMNSWTDLLSHYRQPAMTGQVHVDEFVLGLSRLLSICVSFIKAYKKPVSEETLVNMLFTRFLFPPLSGDRERGCPVEYGAPLLDDETRKELYNLCLSLSESSDSYEWLVTKTATLLERELQGDPSQWNVDRSRWLRAPIGYAGLRNLTNTCYMNSLLAQLFMNTSFRGFMLDQKLLDGSAPLAQQLIVETQTLFANMQDATYKYTDTARFSHAIQPYDSERIDVTVQMDVDEFYSLLFDRWESQLLTSEAKQSFRTFYGGQLITQIKSMDCDHVSEREEPFLAIQCDVKGKTCLAESLKCYVEGDMMEGDNKYKCESCGGRFVNAVKRSCLKNLPDNLIFHLKRFDFDLTTYQRSKINDEFCFSDQIDMMPYQVEYLNNPSAHNQPDIFELVGVLVHNGTAETGHYYSYIRLPNMSDGGPLWGEFNDIEVAEFDPSKIPDQCFGGVWEQPGTDLQFPKNNNAYMLFYRRVSLTATPHVPISTSLDPGPLKVPVPTGLEEEISVSNELLLRRYCLFGSTHAAFFKSMVSAVNNMHGGICSDDHKLEHQILSMALDYMNLVLARVKDVPDVDALNLAIRRLCSTCGECCSWSLKWMVSKHEVTSAMLLQCPNPKIRTLWADLIGANLQELRRHDMQLYGAHLSENANDKLDRTITSGAFSEVVDMLLMLFPTIGKHLRAWDDYFGLWTFIARLGTPEIGALLYEELFCDCLELLLFDKDERFVPIMQRDRNIENIHFLQRTKRNTPLSSVVRLIHVFMMHVNPFDPPVNGRHERLQSYDAETQKFRPTSSEQHAILHLDKRTQQMPFVSRIMEAMDQEQGTKEWYPGAVISLLLTSEPPPPSLIVGRIANSLATSFGEWMPAFSAFLLRSAIYFCRSCLSVEDAIPVITAAAVNAQGLGTHAELKRNVLGSASDYSSQGGHAHLDFFRQLIQLVNPACAASSGDANPFEIPVIKTSGIWAPALLLFDERRVRESTVAILDDLIFDQFPRDIDETDPRALDVARTEVVRIIFVGCRTNVVHAERYGVPRLVVRCLMNTMERCIRWLMLIREDDNATYLRRDDDEMIFHRFQEIKRALEVWRDEDGDENFSETEWASQFDDDESDDMTEA